MSEDTGSAPGDLIEVMARAIAACDPNVPAGTLWAEVRQQYREQAAAALIARRKFIKATEDA